MKILKPITLAISLMAGFLPSHAVNSSNNQSGEDRPPNVLFCIADDASYPLFIAYGCDWVKTPDFERVAKEGILFSNANTPNAIVHHREPVCSRGVIHGNWKKREITLLSGQ